MNHVRASKEEGNRPAVVEGWERPTVFAGHINSDSACFREYLNLLYIIPFAPSPGEVLNLLSMKMFLMLTIKC
jgi:hypothetical protein